MFPSIAFGGMKGVNTNLKESIPEQEKIILETSNGEYHIRLPPS